MNEPLKKAVLIPCFNEELTIGKVIDDFRRELPETDIYVFNNNSTDSEIRHVLITGSRLAWNNSSIDSEILYLRVLD